MRAIRRNIGEPGPVGKSPRNTVSDASFSKTQAKPIKNSSGGSPRSAGPSAPRNAVNKPNQS